MLSHFDDVLMNISGSQDQELEDFAGQQSHIINSLNSAECSQTFANVYFDKFIDRCPSLQEDLGRCDTFFLPSMLEELVSHMLGEDEQSISVSDFDSREVNILKEYVEHKKYHYGVRAPVFL